MRRILHFMASGDIGGIEKLCVTMYPYLKEKHDFCFFWREGSQAETLKKLGAEVYFLDVYANSMWKALKQVSQLYKRNRYDAIIVHHDSPLMWLAALYLNRRYSVNYFLYAHADAKLFLKFNTPYYFKQIMFWRLALTHVEKVIAISRFVKESVVRYGKVKKEQIVVIYNGIEISTLEKKESKTENKSNTIRITFCGRLVKEKGVDYLLNALANIDSEKEIECHIIGDGEERAYLENLTEDLNLQSRVKFWGAQSNIQRWLEQSDIYIHPAICEEGFGLSLVEAMAAGNICIAFKKGGIPEFLQDGMNGFLVDVITSEALAKALENVIYIMGTEEEIRLRIQAEKTAHRFDVKHMVSQLEEIINMAARN